MTVKANWTPGPWVVTDDGYVVAGEKYVHEPNNLGKKCCGGMVISDEVLANTRLIAAAPDLLAALKYLEQRIDAFNGEQGDNNRLCCLCGAASYDAQVGIKHLYSCAILTARAAIARAMAKP